VCLNSQDLRNETYDVLIKNASASSANGNNHSALLFSNGGANTSGIAETAGVRVSASQIGNAQYPQVAAAANQHKSFVNEAAAVQDEGEDIIAFIRSLPVDPLLTESVRAKIIAKVHQRDIGVLGAYHLYLVDGDAEGFKARIIHRALGPPPMSGSANMTVGDLYCSSATTQPLNWTASRTSTAGGGIRL
jgi:hypothetical protein